MLSLPLLLSVSFLLIVLYVAVYIPIIIWKSNRLAARSAISTLAVIALWIGLQCFLSLIGVYSGNLNALPPRIVLFGVLPTVVAIVIILKTKRTKRWLTGLNPAHLIWIHIVRVPVELVLWQLAAYNVIPELMTFEGWNFDIIMGLTAPLVWYFGYKKGVLSPKLIRFWNIAGLVFLAWIFLIAVLSSPFPLQQLAFEQPNKAVLYFPYSLLPTVVVPLVVLCHLISLRISKDS